MLWYPSHMKEPSTLQESTARLIETEEQIKLGGGDRGIERQHRHGRLTARERIELLADKGTTQFECGLFIAHNMYEEFGGAPSAGVVTTITQVGGKYCMVVANDATVKAGAFFPMTCKKIIRAQSIAQRARLPPIPPLAGAGRALPPSYAASRVCPRLQTLPWGQDDSSFDPYSILGMFS